MTVQEESPQLITGDDIQRIRRIEDATVTETVQEVWNIKDEKKELNQTASETQDSISQSEEKLKSLQQEREQNSQELSANLEELKRLREAAEKAQAYSSKLHRSWEDSEARFDRADREERDAGDVLRDAIAEVDKWEREQEKIIEQKFEDLKKELDGQYKSTVEEARQYLEVNKSDVKEGGERIQNLGEDPLLNPDTASAMKGALENQVELDQRAAEESEKYLAEIDDKYGKLEEERIEAYDSMYDEARQKRDAETDKFGLVLENTLNVKIREQKVMMLLSTELIPEADGDLKDVLYDLRHAEEQDFELAEARERILSHQESTRVVLDELRSSVKDIENKLVDVDSRSESTREKVALTIADVNMRLVNLRLEHVALKQRIEETYSQESSAIIDEKARKADLIDSEFETRKAELTKEMEEGFGVVLDEKGNFVAEGRSGYEAAKQIADAVAFTRERMDRATQELDSGWQEINLEAKDRMEKLKTIGKESVATLEEEISVVEGSLVMARRTLEFTQELMQRYFDAAQAQDQNTMSEEDVKKDKDTSRGLGKLIKSIFGRL